MGERCSYLEAMEKMKKEMKEADAEGSLQDSADLEAAFTTHETSAGEFEVSTEKDDANLAVAKERLGEASEENIQAQEDVFLGYKTEHEASMRPRRWSNRTKGSKRKNSRG
jgi:hypothetical protein